MSTSSQNNEIFAKFAVELTKRIVERQDYIDKRIHSIKANSDLDLHAIIAAHSNLTLKRSGWGFDPAGPMIAGAHVTPDELEVIRAYFNGDDVLTAILAQER